jgi:hypothetical protein
MGVVVLSVAMKVIILSFCMSNIRSHGTQHYDIHQNDTQHIDIRHDNKKNDNQS